MIHGPSLNGGGTCSPSSLKRSWPARPPSDAGASGGPGSRLLPLQVLQPPPGHLGLAAALVGRRGLPGEVEIEARQQPVGEQELRQVPRVAAFVPDEVLQLLLVVGDR